MHYQAIFFDRDGTLTHNDPACLRDECLSAWSGHEFIFTDEFFTRHFRRVRQGGFSFAPYKTVVQELAFFRQWYLFAFEELCITADTEARADYLVKHLWYHKKRLYPETVEVLEYFKQRGYRMGVISDCPPSLEMTLAECGLAKYFTSFTASSLVGAGKPDPRIFNTALNTQNVHVLDSLYVDDMPDEADGARDLGFTAFHLDRTGKASGPWVINSLKDIVAYVER